MTRGDALYRPAPLRFSENDAERAARAWGLNCGPAAFAAVLGLTLHESRPHLGDFERKGYMNPTMMYHALRSAGVRWQQRGEGFPAYGLCRVQWEGPWMRPEVPIGARYRYTHWIATQTLADRRTWIFDVNALDGGGWALMDTWHYGVLPRIVRAIPRATGGWHVTHRIEVARPAACEPLFIGVDYAKAGAL